ncbi:hypothetical protein [Cohnella lupini]|uniref:Lipoprotein n=1 Tax=Cohnella lupini TaxID=1294267 RepID=A0A3D9IW08_9BACL|nr:hypothetical protein [Cohnella lupini]RED65885.1 hypothetical protein DFP95_101381 [Cohnella lupini]
MIKHFGIFSVTSGALAILICLQGCMTSSTSLPANEAFALSASALSGSDTYGFAGEVSLFKPGGSIGSKAAYEGEVTLHGNMKMQWINSGLSAASAHSSASRAYRPLQLLESVNDKSNVISYAEKPMQAKPVQIRIQLNEKAASDRVAEGLREEIKLLRSDKELLRGDSVKAEQILAAADERLEKALTTLKANTVCLWTADPKSWFPERMREETSLTYVWEGKTYKEKRISETNFLRKVRNGTMLKVNK